MATPSPQAPPGRTRTVLALLAATFVISVGFGLNMPLLPLLIEGVLGRPGDPRVPLHAGLLAAAFTFALGAGAPLWGALSDRIGRRPVLLIGMTGFTLSKLVFSAPGSLSALYAEQLLSGLSAAAVMPVSSALVGDLAPDDHWRASRLAWLNMALVVGFILGPIAGATPGALLTPIHAGAHVLVAPFAASAVAGALVLLLLWRWIPARARSDSAIKRAPAPRFVGGLLMLTFAVSAAIGVFEVSIAVRGGRALGFTPPGLGVLFTTCSVLMFAAQAAVFSRRVRPAATAALLAPAFAGLALGLGVAGYAPGYASYVAAVALFAASGGVLVPVLAYWVSRHAGGAQGVQLGRQTAAAGFGQAAGSGLAGLIFDRLAEPSGAALWVGAVLMAPAAVLAWRLGRRLTLPEAQVPLAQPAAPSQPPPSAL